MGQSLTVSVFFGAVLPDLSDGPDPRLTREAAIACGVDPNDADERGDWQWQIEERHPTLRNLIATTRSGVGDYTTVHLAAAESVRNGWSGILALPEIEANPATIARWTEAIRQALACLEWTGFDEDADTTGPVAAPEIKIGWHAAASYW